MCVCVCARLMCIELGEETVGLLRGLHKYMDEISYHCDQIPDKCNLREEWFILARNLWSTVHHCRQVWLQEQSQLEVFGVWSCLLTAQRSINESESWAIHRYLYQPLYPQSFKKTSEEGTQRTESQDTDEYCEVLSSRSDMDFMHVDMHFISCGWQINF